MSTDKRTPPPNEPSVEALVRSDDAVPGDQDIPPMPDTPRATHQGQSGTAGSGEDAELQSIGQSQSDRAAGSSS